MASFSFPTSIFEKFEIHLPCSITGDVSLSPRHNATTILVPVNIHGRLADERSVDSSIHISSFQKNGNKIWRIHFSSSQELLEEDARELQESTPMFLHNQETSDSQCYHPVPSSYSIASSEGVMDGWSWNTVQEVLSSAPITQPSFALINNQGPSGEPISLFEGPSPDIQFLSTVLAELSSPSEPSDDSLSPLQQYREPGQDCQLSVSSPSIQSSPEMFASEDEDSHAPAQRTLFHCTAPDCTKTFKRAHSRNNHVKRSHTLHESSNNGTTASTHLCTAPNCGEQFTRNHDRMRHELSQHGICTQFSCSKCNRVFGSPGRLERHQVDKHSNS